MYKDTCAKCGAIRVDNQLGLEPTPEQFIANMVAVFREVRRVLRPDGTLWLNIADTFASKPYEPWGIKPKDECGIPDELVKALRMDGWYRRSTIIWHKPNPMPESVTDRPTKAHEYVFLMTKNARYFYDADAVREGYTGHDQGTRGEHSGNKYAEIKDISSSTLKRHDNPAGRNRRTVWTIPTRPYSGAHFATFPPALVEPCIKAGTSERGCCSECGSPWERVVEKERGHILLYNEKTRGQPHHHSDKSTLREQGGNVTTTGWRPTCECGREDVQPCVVFDPFMGSGTTALVARQLGRRAVGTDLSMEYLELARQRLSLDALEAWENGGIEAEANLDGLPMFVDFSDNIGW